MPMACVMPVLTHKHGPSQGLESWLSFGNKPWPGTGLGHEARLWSNGWLLVWQVEVRGGDINCG